MSGFMGLGNRAFVLVMVLLFSAPNLFAEDIPALKDQKEKESYSIGYQVGLSMQTDGVEVDFDKLILGLKDAIDQKEPMLSADEMKGLIVELRKRTVEARTKKLQEMAVRNAEESEKFLAENAKKDGVRATESGLQYIVLQSGEGDTPGAQDMVTVNYRGSLISGEEFDNSYTRGEPQTFRADRVIKGWTEALQMMPVGSRWKIFVPPHLAYGNAGRGQVIPPNAVLVFEIDLLSFKKAQDAGASN